MTKHVRSYIHNKRCFLIKSANINSTPIEDILYSHNVEVSQALDRATATGVESEIIRQISIADFLVAIWYDKPSSNVIFEIGIAHALRKPILVILVGKYNRTELPRYFDSRGINVVRTSNISDISNIKADIDRFIRYAKPLQEIGSSVTVTFDSKDLSWARSKLKEIRTKKIDRGRAFEDLISKLLEDVSTDFTRNERNIIDGKEFESDFLIWLDDVAYEIGGPIIVECKIYRDGIGSVLSNLTHTKLLLEKLIKSTKASLGLIIFDHDRLGKIPDLHDTPLVISFSADDLIDKIESGKFEQEIILRRHRATLKEGGGDGSN